MDDIDEEGALTRIDIHSMGGDYYGGPMGDKPVGSDSEERKLNQKLIDELALIPGVKEVVPVLEVEAIAVQGKYETWFNIQAMPKSYIERQDIPFVEGGFRSDMTMPLYVGYDRLSSFHDPNANYANQRQHFDEINVDLINKDVYFYWDIDAYYSSQNPDSGISKPKRYPYKAAGYMGFKPEEQQYSPYQWQTLTYLEDLETELHRVFKGKAWPGQPRRKNGKPKGDLIYSSLIVISEGLDKTKPLLNQFKEMGLEAHSSIEYIERMEEEGKKVQLVLGAIGAISLIVAAIGIANTMMMSIYERTKEIGVFKVLGCSLYDIMGMFLAEAGFIGFFGGSIGLIFSLVGSKLINTFSSGGGMTGRGGTISYIPPWLIPLALIFAIMIGMLSGLMPARRAMKLSALEALRNE